jgi:hypothetical protein
MHDSPPVFSEKVLDKEYHVLGQFKPAKVIVKDEDNERDNDNEAGFQKEFHLAKRHPLSSSRLDQENQNVSSVEDRNGKEVDDREVGRQKRQKDK